MTSYIEIEVDLQPAGTMKRDRFKLDNVVCFTQSPTELTILLANGVKVVVEDHMVECISWRVAEVDQVSGESNSTTSTNDFLSHRFDKKD
jgi:hypothetical protein